MACDLVRQQQSVFSGKILYLLSNGLQHTALIVKAVKGETICSMLMAHLSFMI